MRRSPDITITYEDGEGGWIVASVRETHGVHSQGRTHEEARANVIDALRGMLELRTERGLRAPAMLSFEGFLARTREICERATADQSGTPQYAPIHGTERP